MIRHVTKIRRGFSLVEAAIVLGIVGLVIGGIWVAASSVAANVKSNEATVMLNTIINNVYNMYKGMPTPSSNTSLDAALVAAGAVPANLVNAAGNDIVNPWGGDVNVNIIANSPPKYLRVWMYSVPRGKACIDLSASIIKAYSPLRNGGNTSPNLMYLSIGADAINDNAVMGFTPGFEQTLDAIANYCKGSGTIDVSVRFYFP